MGIYRALGLVAIGIGGYALYRIGAHRAVISAAGCAGKKACELKDQAVEKAGEWKEQATEKYNTFTAKNQVEAETDTVAE